MKLLHTVYHDGVRYRPGEDVPAAIKAKHLERLKSLGAVGEDKPTPEEGGERPEAVEQYVRGHRTGPIKEQESEE